MAKVRKVKIVTLKELSKLFQKAAMKTRDPGFWRWTWGRIGVEVHASIIKTFEVGGRPKRWKMRIAGRERNSYRIEPSNLEDTGRLKGAIAWRPSNDPPVGSVKIGLLGGSESSREALKYGPVHHIGTRRGFRIQVRDAPFLLYPLRSISTPRPPRGQSWKELSATSRYGRVAWGKRRSVRVVKRPFLMIQRKEDIPRIADVLREGIAENLWAK